MFTRQKSLEKKIGEKNWHVYFLKAERQFSIQLQMNLSSFRIFITTLLAELRSKRQRRMKLFPASTRTSASHSPVKDVFEFGVTLRGVPGAANIEMPE